MAMKSVLIIFSLVFVWTMAQWTPDPFCPYPSFDIRRFPYYGNCTIYWECYAGTKYVMACIPGLEFNTPLEQCDIPEIAKCDPLASTTANPFTTTVAGTTVWTPNPQCPYPSDETTFFPYPGDCTKYIQCYQGNMYVYDCPEGLWWHQEIIQCDYPGDYCSNNGTTTSTTSDPTGTTRPPDEETDPRCIDGNTSFWPHPSDCSKYIECYNGHSYEMSCPPNLYFNAELVRCVPKEEANCCQDTGSCI